MRLVTPDIEYLLGTRELELLNPGNGISPYYQRILLGDPYLGAIETFQIVNQGSMFRGTLCVLIIGTLHDERTVIELRNQDVIPNGQIVERPMFKFARWVNDLSELKEIFQQMGLVDIILNGFVTDDQVKTAQKICG